MKKILFALLSFCVISVQAQNIDAAVDLLKSNKRQDALNKFEDVIKAGNGSSATNAKIGKIYTLWTLLKDEEAFNEVINFYKTEDNPYPYIYAMWSLPFCFGTKEPLPKAKVELLNMIVNSPKSNGTIKAMAHQELGDNFERLGKFKERDLAYSKIGSIDNWQVLGTFDNISGSGFSKDWGAVSNPKPDAKFKNKVNEKVSWFSPPFAKSNKWHYFDYYFDYNNSIVFAQSFVKSETDQVVFLQAGCSGSIKIWVNDALVISESVERNCDMDIYTTKVKLNTGVNRFLVQVGESETNSANFLIRLTDQNGNPVVGVQGSKTYADYKKAKEETLSTLPFFAEEFFKSKLNKNNNSFFDRLLFSEVLMRNDKVFEARKELQRLKPEADKSSLVSHRLLEAFNRDKNSVDATKEIEHIKEVDPKSVIGFQMLISDAEDKEDYDEYEKLVNDFKKTYGESSYSDEFQLTLFSYKKMIPELIDYVYKLNKKYPQNYSYALLAYKIEFEKSKNYASALRYIDQYMKQYFSQDAMALQINGLFKQGATDKAIKMMMKRIEYFPYGIGYYRDLSSVYYSLGRYSESAIWNQKVLDFAPYHGPYLKESANIYKAMNEKLKSKDYLQKAIKYSPTDYDARAQLRELEGEKDLYKYFPSNNIDSLVKIAPKAEQFPDHNTVVMLHDRQRIVYAEDASEKKEEILVKVLNEKGVENWKDYTISLNKYNQRLVVEEAYVIKKGGSKVKAESSYNTLVFTNLEPNDFVYLKYKIEDHYQGKLAAHFWDETVFQYYTPSVILRYSILSHISKKYKYNVVNGELDSYKAEYGNFELRVWEQKNPKPIESEYYTPVNSDFVTTLYYSSIPDWNYVSNWYHDLSSSLAKQDFEIEEIVDQLLKGKENASNLEKARVFYNYIVSNITYSNISFLHGPIIPQKASTTLRSKQGDCKDLSTLFLAMCREAKIDAGLILVNTKDNGLFSLHLPSPDFNHCIGEFKDGNKKYILEFTDPKLPFAALPSTVRNAVGLRINDSKTTAQSSSDKFFIIEPTTLDNKILRKTTIAINNKEIVVKRQNTRYGFYSSSTRSKYLNLSTDKQIKEITSAISSDYTSPVKVSQLNFENLEDLIDSVVYDYTFNVKAITEIAGISVLSLQWADKISNPDFVVDDDRKNPFDLWRYDSSKELSEEIIVSLPANAIIQEKIENVKLSSPFLDYSITFDYSQKGKVICNRSIFYKQDRVSQNEYTQMRDIFNKIVEADSKQIVYK